jgi:hypothetical protein
MIYMILSRKYANMLVAAFMPFIISFVATFYCTSRTAESLLTLEFIATWLGSWVRAYALALPVSLASAPFIRKFVDIITY